VLFSLIGWRTVRQSISLVYDEWCRFERRELFGQWRLAPVCRPVCISPPMLLCPLAAVLPGGCSGASLDTVPNSIGRRGSALRGK